MLILAYPLPVGQLLETISVFGDNLIHSNGIKVATMALRGLLSQIRGVQTVGTSQHPLHFFSRTLPGCAHDLSPQFSAHSPVCVHVSDDVVSM